MSSRCRSASWELDKVAGGNMFAPPHGREPLGIFLNLFAPLGDRLTAGQRILAPLIKVRILVPQLSACHTAGALVMVHGFLGLFELFGSSPSSKKVRVSRHGSTA